VTFNQNCQAIFFQYRGFLNTPEPVTSESFIYRSLLCQQRFLISRKQVFTGGAIYSIILSQASYMLQRLENKGVSMNEADSIESGHARLDENHGNQQH